jgi:DNA-binding protein WhiA
MLAEIAGFLRVSGSIRLAGGGRLGIVATTENAATARHFKKLIKQYFRSNAGLAVGDSQMPGTTRRKSRNKYYLNITPEEKSMQILRETGMILIREGDDYFSDGIYSPIVRSKCCRKAYLRGLFLSCGTISDPKKSYHLEFVLDKEQSANDLKKLIGTFVDLSANISRRGDNYIVYIKKAQYISDLLGIMGADNAVLEFENIRISKSLHGDVQRMLNCDNANVDRTLSAAEEQRGWIRKIAEDELGREPLASELADPGSVFWTDGLRHLPSQLKEVAFIRLYKPEASLAEIGETLNPPIGKPAVSKRFARLKAMAEM